MKKINYKKLQISVFTISFVIILVCSLYLTNIISYADSFTALKTKFGFTKTDFFTLENYQSSDLFLSTAHINFKPSSTSSDAYNFAGNSNNILPIPSSYTGTESDYFFVYSGGGNLYYGYFTENTIVNSYNNIEIWIPQDELQYVNVVCRNEWDYLSLKSMNNNQGSSFFAEIDGETYYKAFDEGNSQSWLIYGNLPIYSVSDFSSVTSFSDLSQSNYSSGYSEAFPDNGEKADNNLVFTSPDWSFKHNQYFAPYSKTIDTGSVYPYGTINFEFLPNEYQSTHSSLFTVNLIFEFDYSVTHTFGSGALATKTNDYFYFKYDNNGSTSINVPLDTFISNGNQYSITFEDVFKNLKDSNRTLGGVLLQNKEVDLTEYNKFNLYCYAKLVSGEDSSGNYTEWYNPINKKGYTTDRNGETNKNPYSQEGVEDNSTSMEVPGDAGTNGDNSQTVGGGSSASASTGAITINNNINNNTSNDLKSGGLISTIISLLGDNVSNGSDSVESLAGVNGYVELANTTLSSVPNSLWMVIVTTFSAVVVITIIAFIISILFKIFF